MSCDAVDPESLAALCAIEFAANVCPSNMIFEGDCLQVIKALNSTEFDLARVGNTYVLAREKFSLIQNMGLIMFVGRVTV